MLDVAVIEMGPMTDPATGVIGTKLVTTVTVTMQPTVSVPPEQVMVVLGGAA